MVDNTNNTQQTFEQWLETKNDLTPAQRQALIERNSQANVTFTPESFDRYLEELRAAGENSSSNSSSSEITPEQYKEAIDLSKGDLSKLSYDEITKVWSVLGQLDDKIAQTTKPEALQAKLKMADYAEQLMSKVNPNQPWSMTVAPEVSEWLKISNDIQANNNSQEKKDRNAKIGESLNKFYKQFDEENGLSNLTPEHASILAANQQALEAAGKDMDPFAKNEQGEYLYAGFDIVDKFYDKLEIDNSDKRSDTVDKNQYKQDMAELAYNEAVLELSMNPDFNKLNAEQQKQLLAQAWSSHMQMGMVTMIAAQMAENAAKESGESKKIKEFENQAQTFISKAVNGENNTFKVSNNAALATLSYRTTRIEGVSKRIGQKTGHKSLWSKIKEFDKKLTKKYPKSYAFLKNLAISSAIGLTTGGFGLAAYSVYKTGKAIKQSYQHYKEANTDGQYKSWFGYLRKNPKEAIGLAASVTGSIMSVAFVGMDGLSVTDFGLGGQVYQNGLDNTWTMMKDTVSNAFSSPDAVKDQPWSERMNAWGKNFGHQVANTMQDGQRVARLGISLSGGVSSSAIDFIASFREKDPEKKKQLRKNAWKTLGGVFAGSLVSLGFTGFMKANNPDSPLPHDSPVDGDDFKPEIIRHDKPIGPEPYQPTEPHHGFAPEQPHHSPVDNKPHIDVPHDKGPEMPTPQRPDLSSMTKPSEMPTHIDPIEQNHLPQTDNERALFEELRRGHNIGAEDATVANAAAVKDFNHYMELKEQGNFAEADKFLSSRHQQFENAEHEVSNQVSDDDSRKVAGAKAEADKAYSDYKAALNDLKNNPNSPEAQANFDKAAMEMAKADVDKTEAVLKQEIRGLNDTAHTHQEQLEKLGLQRNAYEQEHGTLKSIEKDMVKLGLDPNNLPQDVSNLSTEAQELILHHKNLTQYDALEGQLKGRISGVEQEISARKEVLHDLHSRHEETAGNAVNQHVAGYESYEGSRLQDLNEKIAVESRAPTQDNAQQNQTDQTPPTKPEEKVEEQTPPTKPEEKVEDQTPPTKPEEKVEEQTPPTKPEEKVEEQTAEQDSLKDFSWDNVPPKDIHQCDSGIYTISGDENRYSMHYDRIIITSNDSNEFRAKLTVETDGENFYINGLKQENSDSYIDKGMIAQELALGEKIYDDLQARAANGETLGAAERNFMKDHEADLKSYGLTHDKDGNVVTIAEEQAKAAEKVEALGNETQKRLDELGLHKYDDLGNVPSEQIRTLYDGGKYHIKEDGNVALDQVALTQNDMMEMKSFISQDGEGNMRLNGVELTSRARGMMEIRHLARCEKIYDDLVQTSSVGDTLSEGEQTFMQKHEAEMNKYGLSHDKNGRIVKTSELNKQNTHGYQAYNEGGR